MTHADRIARQLEGMTGDDVIAALIEDYANRPEVPAVTWKEFKEWVDSQDVREEDELRHIVWSAEHRGIVTTIRTDDRPEVLQP